MSGRRGLQLERVVLLGRTLDEYRKFFLLDPEKLRGRKLLDCAAGVSSFSAEANALGIDTVAVDPIYDWTHARISERAGPDLEYVYENIQHVSTYRWASSYETPERMRELRARASSLFLEDFLRHGNSRYIPAGLPHLPFEDGAFDLTVVSYFLFVYQENFSLDFHRAAIAELMRVTRGEARIYPTVTFEAERSSYLDALKNDPAMRHLQFEEVPTTFEFLANSNSFLRITHRA